DVMVRQGAFKIANSGTVSAAPKPLIRPSGDAATPAIQSMSERSLLGCIKPSDTAAAFDGATSHVCVSGSTAPPGRFEPPFVGPRANVPRGPSGLLTTGGV